MSGQIVGGIIGIGLSFATGGAFTPAMGWMIGSIAGGLLFPQTVDGPRLDDLKAQSSEYGRPLAITYGNVAIGGNVIWASDLVEEEGDAGKGGGGGSIYSYYGNMAVAVCEGERTLGRIWAGPEKRLIWDGATLEGADSGAVLRWYTGSETQLPDALIESYEGAGNVPGYRGTAYLVLEHFPVIHDGNRLPFLTIEVAVTSASTPAPENLGVVFITQVLVFDDKYATFYWGTYTGVVIRYQADNTLYAHYTYDFDEWVLTFDRWFWDEARNVFVRYTANALRYTTVDVTTGVQTPHTYTAAGGADTNPGLNVVGACMQDGSYVFAAKGSPLAPSRATLYIVDPATHTCTATYCGDLLEGELTGPLMAPPGASYVVGYSTGTSTDRLYKMPLTSGFTPVDMGAMTMDASYVDIDPNTGYVWSVKRDVGTGDITLTINDPATTVQVAQRVITGSAIAGIGSRPLTFIAGTPNKVLLTGSVWLATDGFRLLNATTLADISGTDIVGGYYGTAAPTVVAYVPATDGLISLRQGGMMTFAPATDPAGLNFFEAGFVQSADNKYMGEADAAAGSVTLQPQLLSEIVADLSERAGLDASQYDVTQLTDLVDGYAIERATTVREAITALMPAYFFDAVESDGKAKFVKRGGAIAAVIDDDELGAYESGSDPTDPLETVRRMEDELPKTLNVRYLLQASDYDQASRYARRLVGASGDEQSLDLPLVLSDTKAQEIAEVNLHGAWVGRITYRFSLPRKYGYLEPTDIIVVQGYTMRLEKVTYNGGRLQCEARHDDSNVYTPHVVVTETPGSGKDVMVNTEVVLELLGVNMIRDADDDAGFYAAVCARNPASIWGGAAIYASSNGGTSYSTVATAPNEATMGYTTTALGDFFGGNIVDELSSVNVSLLNGSLSSTDYDGLLSGTNAAVIGDEIVFFRDATLQGNGSYTLTGFLRGRRGSEYAMGTHAAADRFVLLNTALVRIAQVSADIGVAKLYKAVHAGSTLAAATAENFTNEGNSVKPYAPVHLGGGRNAANDVTLAWVRRGRISGEWRNLVDVPLGETSEAYEVEIYSSSAYSTLKRTISGITSQSTVYTAAQQTTDFGAPPAEIYFIVYQMSTTVGRGWPGYGHLPAADTFPVPSPAPTGPFSVGVNIHTGGADAGENTAIAAEMLDRNFTRMRMDLIYDAGPFTLVRDMVTKINANGGSVEVTLQTSYQWDNTIYTGGSLATIEADAYAEAYAAVDAMKDLVHDYELLNEIPLRSECLAQVAAGTGQSESAYTGKTAFISIAAVLRGMANAIHDIAASSGLPLRVILGTVNRDWGFLRYMETLGVEFDVVGYHIYPWEYNESLLTDPWFGTGGPLVQLATFGRPVTINEFNSGEIYDGSYENTAGGTVTETGFQGLTAHLQDLYSQGIVDIESVVIYELFDEPAKTSPENHFGVMYDIDTPKVSHYIVTAFAGGTLTSGERLEITSRGLLTDPEIDAMQQ